MFFTDIKTQKLVSEKGWTAIELLVVAAILSVVIAASFELFRYTYRNWQEFYNGSLVRQEAIGAIDWMKKDLREALPLKDEPHINYASGNRLVFYSNTDLDDEPEKVEYILSQTHLLRKIYQPDNPNPPYNYVSSPSVTTLTAFCRNGTQDPIFSYFASTTETLTSLPLSETDRRKVKIVKISLKMDYDTSNPPGVQEFSGEVKLRNAK